MPIKKIDRKELKEMLVSILDKSATFKMLSESDEINPCRISFDGMEFYIYIKNLSPAQLSNNNPDIWRIQLPIRDDFNSLKEKDIPFIALGYDDENRVFATWNPYWVKQRLNAAKSVSLYSRFSLQKVSNETQLVQKLNLNNDNEVVVFPCSKLGYYLVNIKQYFPEMTDYVAMGSRKRSEANAAYRCLCDGKNVTKYAHYLTNEGYADTTIGNYCRAIKKLMSDGFLSRYRKIFLACDSLKEYPSVIDDFFEIPEIDAINESYHRQLSNAFRTYILFLQKNNNLNNEVKNDSNEGIDCELHSQKKSEKETREVKDAEDVDWEDLYTDSYGKLTCIANPQVLEKLRPVLDTEYRKLPVAYQIVSDFYGERYQKSMELKDWNRLFNQIDWVNPYIRNAKMYSDEKRIRGDEKLDNESKMTDKQFNDAFTGAGGWFFLTQYQFIANAQLNRNDLLRELFAKGFDSDISGTNVRLSSVQSIIRKGRVKDALIKIRDSKRINAVHPEAKEMAEEILGKL